MTTKKLTYDANAQSIQVMEPVDTTSKIAVAVGSASVALPSGAGEGDVVRIACTTNCYIKFGTSGVTATTNDIIFPIGVEYFRIPASATHLAAIRVDTDGVLTINEVK